ncbi:hypothetical protein PUR61_44900 [Streptomyces sp. BE20]|uniref:hypothetical protein n=1 Tax=Streptomyces sp. BE20 TaxID=3002525 RepID=UPI002E75E0FE|nr:hypothetical protein [Streptomyces sp. BE20]MEE1829256.1 hypothetical protein [Streptomyces sp. BE20]
MNERRHRKVVTVAAGPIPREWAAASPFAGLDVCQAAGWEVEAGFQVPVFDEDFWDFSGVVGLPRALAPSSRRADFTKIVDPSLRLTAKEYVFAVLAPMHETVLALPDANRAPVKPATVSHLTKATVAWMNFVTGQGLGSLAEVLQEHCDAYQALRVQGVRGNGREIAPGTMANVLKPVQELAGYGKVFSADAYRPGFKPWPKQTIVKVVGRKVNYAGDTLPVAEEVFAPTVAAALFLVETVGPLLTAEFETLESRLESQCVERITAEHMAAFQAVLDRYVREQSPLPECNERLVNRRVTRGWAPNDPMLRLDFSAPWREATGYGSVFDAHIPLLRPLLMEALDRVGVAGAFGRNAALVPRADAPDTLVPWTEPLTADGLRDLVQITAAACRVLVAALSGMRASELDELTGDSAQEPVEVRGGTSRFRLASKLIKGKPLGGVDEEWVVLEPAWRAVKLAAQLRQAGGKDPVFAGHMSHLHSRLRQWVNGPAGQRLGLAAIPPGPVNGRMLRKTLALELSHRPGGLLAAKIHLKHISVVTTEGYAMRPGGSQGSLQAEVQRAAAGHHLELTRQAFNDYRAGRMPAGPGARDLIKAFEHIDAALKDHEVGTAAVLDNERRLEMLLRQQSKSLHLQAANYCWFRDPSKALCLKLAGTPEATKPLAGMCDSARCPQATHHPCHLPVWQSQAATNKVFLANPRFPKGEKTRLMPELERAQRVVDEIITANAAHGGE